MLLQWKTDTDYHNIPLYKTILTGSVVWTWSLLQCIYSVFWWCIYHLKHIIPTLVKVQHVQLHLLLIFLSVTKEEVCIAGCTMSKYCPDNQHIEGFSSAQSLRPSQCVCVSLWEKFLSASVWACTRTHMCVCVCKSQL